MRLIALAFLFAGPALADCPVRAQLDSGVTLVRDDPFFGVSYLHDDGVLTETRRMSRGGTEVRRSSTYENALAVRAQDSENGTVAFEYLDDMDRALDVNETGDFATTFRLIVDGARYSSGEYHLYYEGEGRVQIGECAYDTWVLRNESEIEGMEPILFLWDYAPDLGIVIRTEQIDPAGGTLGVVAYDRILEGTMDELIP
ncbi:hypothetical protein [Maritimibacter sp. UBA3975]|uniref:hypothetical protein n=1 Tax=Maritimibacter sp. UBA3975 TaxID=1946833 RepID=UPI000C0A1551|nr:hypothetical protein [Maritimibacter sp. UBA3975]MAM62689.1 hypothetical protein [Maritimibacter sp.]|tara:strand:+ start:30478 stop:31077 length:600 start_codon:yes stop_codon:yes gene_type:complete